MSDVTVDIKNLNKTFRLSNKNLSFSQRMIRLLNPSKRKRFQALKDINFTLYKGDNLGIIGHNGSGKTTLLKLIINAMNPDDGSVIFTKGKIIRLALGMGFDVNLSARDNIYVNGTILGLSFKEIGDKFEEIIEFSELENFVDTPIKFFSSGMKSRLSFAIALHAEADIFLIDEFFGDVGDEIFKRKSQKAFEDNILKDKTIIHVSHSLDLIKNYCNKVLVLSKGEGQFYTDIDRAIGDYRDMASS